MESGLDWKNTNSFKVGNRAIVDVIELQNLFPCSANKYNDIYQRIVFPEWINTLNISNYDTKNKFNKVYASAFISDNKIMFGTKDNKLFLQNLNTSKLYNIPMLAPLKSKTKKSNQINDICHIKEHNIIVTNGVSTTDMVVYDADTLIPFGSLSYHKDWVYSIDTIDGCIVGGSKDGCVSLWNINQIKTEKEHKINILNKPDHSKEIMNGVGIRCLKTNNIGNTGNIVCLMTDGSVYIYDAIKDKVCNTIYSCIPIKRSKSVCMDIDYNRGNIIVGSQLHIKMFDPRISFRKNNITNIKSNDDIWGVRSLSINCDIMTVGGGLCRLSFIDLKTNKYLNIMDKENNEYNSHLQIKSCWIRNDGIYRNIFKRRNIPTPSAIYTHSYSPSNDKIFVAGGPSSLGLYGSFIKLLS